MSSSADSIAATIAAYEQDAGLYAQHSLDRSGLTHLHTRFVNLLSAGAAVLDLGGGPGHDAAELARRGLAVTNCDPTSGLLVEARSHREITGRLVQADARRLAFGDASFDGIWACASLLHIVRAEVGLALAEAYRLLKPSGLLFTSMQEGNLEGIAPASDTDPVAPRFYVFYNASEWRDLVESAGFVLMEQRVAPGPGGLNPGATGWIETFGRKA